MNGLQKLPVFLAAVLFVSSCCNETSEYPRYHFYQLHARLDLERTTLTGLCGGLESVSAPAPHAGVGEFAVGPLTGRTRPEIDRIPMVLRNTSMSPIEIRWAEGAWIDELGRRHRLEFLPEDWVSEEPLADTLIRPGEEIRLDLIPDEKRYAIDFRCAADAMYREPLVPFDYKGRTRESVQAFMRDLQSKPTRVHLSVPVVIDGSTCELRFSWRIRDRLNMDQPPPQWGELH